MQLQRFPAIARDLEQRLKADPAFSLPTLNRISEEYEVSYPTAWKAAQALIRKGLARSVPGKGIVAIRQTGGNKAHESESLLSVDCLCKAIREDIRNGVYKSGRPFPKGYYFMSTYRVTRLTVTRALRRLAEENLAHKHKNRWVVGAAPSGGTSAKSLPPVVLCVLTDTVDALPNFFTNQFLSPFVLPLRTDLASRGISLSVAAWYGDPRTTSFIPLEGRDGILSEVKRLGHRYQGTVLISVSPSTHDLRKTVADFIKLGKPVVYFDSSDEGDFVTREKPYPGKLYRLHFDERASVKTALNRLVDAGHRCIGMHGSDLYDDWSPRRARILGELAAAIPKPPRIIVSGGSEKEWALPSPDEFVEQPILSTQTGSRRGTVRIVEELRKSFIQKAPSLVKLLSDYDVTALMAINDNFARKYYFWMRILGIELPRHLSMVSFDNMAQNTPYPLSSVDFGFERLGYLAAHILIGDISVPCDRAGNIGGIPTVVDRGSIGEPGGALRKFLTL